MNKYQRFEEAPLVKLPEEEWRKLKIIPALFGGEIVEEVDFNSFLEENFEKVAKAWDISQECVKRILKERNQSFYYLKEQFYANSRVIKNDEQLRLLKSTFMLPDIRYKDKKTFVEALFQELTSEEKTEILKELYEEVRS